MSGCGHLSIKDLRQVCSSCSHASLCLPVGLEPADLQQLDNLISKRRVVNKGSYVFKVGDNFERLIAVRSGAFKTTNDNAEGAHSVIGFYLPGELIGFDGIAKGIHQISAQAIETSSICEIPFNDLLSFASKMPSLQRQLISIMSQQTIPDMTLRLNHSAEQRVASFLLDLSRRFKNCGYSASEFNLPMSREEIANYLGLAPETISRLLSHLQTQNIVNIQRRHVVLKDMQQLQDICV